MQYTRSSDGKPFVIFYDKLPHPTACVSATDYFRSISSAFPLPPSPFPTQFPNISPCLEKKEVSKRMVSYSSLCVYWRWPSSLHKLQVLLVVCSAFLVHLSIGTIYTYGNMVPYIISYVRMRSHPTDLHYNSAPYILTMQIAGQGLTMLAGGHLERRFGPRLVTLAGGWIMSLGFFLTYFAIKVSYWLMLVDARVQGTWGGSGLGIHWPHCLCHAVAAQVEGHFQWLGCGWHWTQRLDFCPRADRPYQSR